MATKVATVGTVDIAHFAPEERQLSDLAYQWRGEHDAQRAAHLVQQYQQTAEAMRQRGWDGYWLSADDMLPDDLMPDFLKGG